MLHPLFKLRIKKVDTTEKPQTHETEKDYRVLLTSSLKKHVFYN